jgi:hypothetical protein
MNQFISKIPKPIIVLVALLLAVVFFVYNDPLKDECEIQAQVFQRNTKGILTSVKKNKKIQYAQISFLMDRCKEGNSLGACSEYFEALGKIATELKTFKEKCQLKYSKENESFQLHLARALQVMSLVAWGEKAPAGIQERVGWMNEAQLRTFCYLKKAYLLLAGEENFNSIRNRIYLEYPDAWPEKKSSEDVESRNPENRPKALKTSANPKGTLEMQQVFERSLFSIRCDLYL